MNEKGTLKGIMLIVLVLFCLFIALTLTGGVDFDEEVRARIRYCEMVSLWNLDKDRGVPTEKRRGWPPFNGECN